MLVECIYCHDKSTVISLSYIDLEVAIMNLSSIVETVINHVSETRKIDLSVNERNNVSERLEKYIVGGDYSFIIPTVGVSYSEGKNSDYPRLYGDAVLAYAVSIMMQYKESSQRKSQAC